MSCRRSSEETAHDRPHPALRHRDSPIGPDVDLDEDDVRLADGTGLTGQRAEEVVEEVRRRGGRPSLTGEAAASPPIAFRVTPDGTGRQTSTWAIERAIRSPRPGVAGLPEAFRLHALRHYLASLLIGSGLDVEVVQHRRRHGSAKTTLDTYGHLWPDSDESARAAGAAVLAARADSSGTAGASQG